MVLVVEGKATSSAAHVATSDAGLDHINIQGSHILGPRPSTRGILETMVCRSLVFIYTIYHIRYTMKYIPCIMPYTYGIFWGPINIGESLSGAGRAVWREVGAQGWSTVGPSMK